MYINPSLLTQIFPKRPELQSDNFLIKRIKNKLSAAKSRLKKKIDLKNISNNISKIRMENKILNERYQVLRDEVEKFTSLVEKI
jgi:hypothetical protein